MQIQLLREEGSGTLTGVALYPSFKKEESSFKRLKKRVQKATQVEIEIFESLPRFCFLHIGRKTIVWKPKKVLLATYSCCKEMPQEMLQELGLLLAEDDVCVDIIEKAEGVPFGLILVSLYRYAPFRVNKILEQLRTPNPATFGS